MVVLVPCGVPLPFFYKGGLGYKESK
jgi:hypothetical protein